MLKYKFLSLVVAALSICFTNSSAQKVVMAGDSHVALKTYPEKLGNILEQTIPGLSFESFGIGGAGFYTYIDKPKNMQRLRDANADILIIALGSNDCNNWYYSSSKLRQRALTLYHNVKEHNPDCKIVFVTPFFFKTKEVRGTALEINPNIEDATEVLVSLAQELPDVWTVDVLTEHGMDFLDNGLMYKDFMHLSKEGYEYLAEIVAEGLLSQPGLLDNAPSPINP